MENGFDLFGSEMETEVKVSKPNLYDDLSVVCEAIQIIRLKKSVMTTHREVIDTIKIDGAKMTYERALKITKFKAQKLGNCMVIEKFERINCSY
jgi:hypothetical protein